MLSLQACDPGHYTQSILFEKTIKLNSQSNKY
jgi:hypothetical protein